MSNPNDAYDVTDPNWKKSYIRANDGLPDLAKVIGADLDLRYLYRNQVQLKIGDSTAELYNDKDTSCDGQDLKELLQQAAEAFDFWLGRIRYGDVRDALEAALAGQTTRADDSWIPGPRALCHHPWQRHSEFIILRLSGRSNGEVQTRLFA
jgi:hypothetical protein